MVVTVRDPQQPAGPGSQVCVHLQVSTTGGTAGGVAKGSSCWATGAPDGPPVELAPSDAVVGCATVMGREPYPTTDGTRPVEHTFTFTAPESVVPDGLHTVEATVVSGVGDGCDPSVWTGRTNASRRSAETLQFG